MTRQSKSKVGWTVVLVGTAVGCSYETWINSDGRVGEYAAIFGFLFCFAASVVTALKLSKYPADKYIKYTFFLYLPVFFVPCFGMMHYTFRFYGIYCLSWPLMLALFYVFNPRSMNWVMGRG